MPTTLEQFKQAFSDKVSDDLLNQRDQQAKAALKDLMGVVQSLDKTAPATERHRIALVALTERYAETKKGNGRPQDKLGRELEEIHRDTLAQITQAQGSSQAASAPTPTAAAPPPAGSADGPHEVHLDDGQVSSSPQSGDEESNYRGNLQGIQAELDKALNATAPDSTSREIQNRLKAVHTMMTGAAIGGDFKQANYYADELLGILREYQQAVDAYNKRDKAARDAQAAFVKRYDELKLEIDTIKYFLAPPPGSTDVQNEIEREEQLMNAAVVEANFALANQHLDKIAAAVTRFKDMLAKHNQAITEKERKEAPKRAFDANFNEIKASLEAHTKRPLDPKEPFAEQRKKLIELHKQLKTQLSAKEPDYKAANAQVTLIRRTLFPYQANLAALKKQQDDAAEAKARETYPGELLRVDAWMYYFEDVVRSSGAPFDKKAGAILDKLKEKRKYFAQSGNFMAFTSRLYLVREMQQLIADYQAASAEFWKAQYDVIRGQLPAKDVKAALDPKGSKDDLMKDEQDKLKRHMKYMDRFAGAKEFYQATLEGYAASRQLRKFKLLSYKVPGPDGKEIVIKARLLGPAIQGPDSHTLLMLLDKQGQAMADADGAGLNKDGAVLLKTWTSVHAQELAWKKQTDFILKDVAQSEATLKEVVKAGKAIVNGAGGKELVTAIVKYKDLTFGAKEALHKLNEEWKAYEKALMLHNGAILNSAERAAKREKSKSDEAAANEAENVKKQKSDIKSRFGDVVTFIATPKWETVKSIIKTIGLDAIGDAIADALVSTKRLKELQAAATLAAEKLEGIENQKDLNDIGIALKDVEKAVDVCKRVKVAFERAGFAMDAAEKDVAMAMNSGGMPDAGKAVEKRRKIYETVAATKPVLEQYVKDSEALGNNIETLRVRYLNFSAANAGALDIHMESIHSTAQGNAESLRDFGDYLRPTVADAKWHVEYLAGEDYLKKYDSIGSELVKAIMNRKK